MVESRVDQMVDWLASWLVDQMAALWDEKLVDMMVGMMESK